MIARKELPVGLQAPYRAFLAVLAEVEPAKAALIDVVPGTRLPGRPLNDAATEYRARLVRARGPMPGWRTSETEAEWQACDLGLREALGRVGRLQDAAEDPAGFEALLAAVERLLDPLDPFGTAAERFRALRCRRRRTD